MTADCDTSNNSAECGYDSGDCCSCTCVDTDDYTCGENGDFQCIDPAAPCVDDDDITADQVENCSDVSRTSRASLESALPTSCCAPGPVAAS